VKKLGKFFIGGNTWLLQSS